MARAVLEEESLKHSSISFRIAVSSLAAPRSFWSRWAADNLFSRFLRLLSTSFGTFDAGSNFLFLFMLVVETSQVLLWVEMLLSESLSTSPSSLLIDDGVNDRLLAPSTAVNSSVLSSFVLQTWSL